MSARRLAATLVAAGLLAAGCGPPSIPHTIEQSDDTYCLECHLEGEEEAPVTPHPDNVQCVGCHAPTGTKDVGALAEWPMPAGLSVPPGR